MISKKKNPRILNIPVTEKCNSKCIMCGIWRNTCNDDLDVSVIDKILSDKLIVTLRSTKS